MQRSVTSRRKRPGPEPRWGKRQQLSVGLPEAHRAVYQQEANSLGISLNEYIVRFLAAEHGLWDGAEEVEQQGQLRLGA